MPLNEVLASNRVSHSKAPSVRFNRTTVPFNVPTKTESLKTAGEENPLAFDVFQRIWPVAESSATVQHIVVTKTLPSATAGVDPISRFPVSRSTSTRIESGAAKPATPEL